MRDIYHNIKVTQHVTPVVATSTQTSSAIDLQGYNSANIVFAVGQSGDTLSGGVYWTLKLQESDTDSGYTDVAASDISSGAATVVVDDPAEDDAAYSLGYIGTKRYVKAVVTPTGSHSNGTPIGVIALRGDAGYRPVE
ncbi:MAG: hypothetical protein AB7L92_05420 [Alphaproteobacteria bacterium]